MFRAGFSGLDAAKALRNALGGVTIRTLPDDQSTQRGEGPLRRSDYNGEDRVKEVARYHPSSLLDGVIYGAAVAVGNYYIHKTVPAGQSWDSTYHDADEAAFGTANLTGVITSPSTPTKRMLVSKDTLPANTTLAFSFDVPGDKVNTTDIICKHYFGGPNAAGGRGAYCLFFTGDGNVTLFEKRTDVAGGWDVKDNWRYLPTSQVNSAVVKMAILPYNVAENVHAIDFLSDIHDKGIPGNSLTSFRHDAGTSLLHHYPIPVEQGITRPHAIGAGNLRHDLPVDSRGLVQAVIKKFYDTMTQVDAPFHLPFPMDKTSNLTLSWVGTGADGTSIICKLFNAETSTELSLVSSTASSRTYVPTYGQSRYYVQATHSADADNLQVPTLWSYAVIQNGLIEELTPTEVVDYGLPQSISISGPESDPSLETAQLEIEDLQNQLTLLSARAKMAVQIETEYDSADASKRVKLFRGYVGRATATRKGTSKKRGMIPGAADGGATDSLYPSAHWNKFSVACTGQFTRLQESSTTYRLKYNSDIDHAFPKRPWKVTDILHQMLNFAGYPDDMISIDDSEQRLFVNVANQNDQSVAPLTQIGPFIVDMARKYLGWYLLFDANAGTRGKWIIRKPPIAPYTSQYTFTTQRPAGLKLAHVAGAYGANKTFISKGSMQTYVKPPEANFVLVTGSGAVLPDKNGHYNIANWMVNPKSFNFLAEEDGTPIITADPTHPDYLGRFVPLYIVDTSLNTQPAVDWFTRRYYDFTCHAIKMLTFTAPLVFIDHEEGGGKKRPLRYYDPVTITDSTGDSTFLVRTCNPTYRKDFIQMARYECESPRI